MIQAGFLYPNAFTARAYGSLKNAGEESTQKAIASAILTAIDGGLFTTTVSVSGLPHPEKDVRNLQDIGYTVSLSGTSLTVSW